MTGTSLPRRTSRHGETVAVGQHEVEQHDVGFALGKPFEALPAVGRLQHREALVLEGQPQDAPDTGVVLDEKHPSPHGVNIRPPPATVRRTRAFVTAA